MQKVNHHGCYRFYHISLRKRLCLFFFIKLISYCWILSSNKTQISNKVTINPMQGKLSASESCMPTVFQEKRPSLKPSAQDLSGQSSADPPRSPLPLSELESSQFLQRAAGILTSARNRLLVVDLQRQLKFSSHIPATTLRPDTDLVSETTKQVVLLELTVPWEECLDERKPSKYV